MKPLPDLDGPRAATVRAALGAAWRWRDGVASQCPVCALWCRGALCPSCRERFLPPACRCTACGLRLASQAASCLRCAIRPSLVERTVCVTDYAFPWNRLISEFKFGHSPEHARWLAPLMADAVAASGANRPDLVVPVPLHPGRLAERGYNQAWELARRVAAQLGVATRSGALQRLHAGASQARLGRAERLANLRDAFVVDPIARRHVAGVRIALVDDVMTTGATLDSAAAALRRAGAAAVEAWVIARTPE